MGVSTSGFCTDPQASVQLGVSVAMATALRSPALATLINPIVIDLFDKQGDIYSQGTSPAVRPAGGGPQLSHWPRPQPNAAVGALGLAEPCSQHMGTDGRG